MSYRECIVTFFDILGFRALLETKSPEDIAESLAVFRQVSRHGAHDVHDKKSTTIHPSTTRIEIVSDAIVRIRPNAIDPSTKMSELFDELIVLKEIQIECLRRGILLRGATTIGPMYVDPDPFGPVFGPALVEAFEMESREVIYPRIAVHSDVVERYKNSNDAALVESYSVDLEMVALLLTQDGAGLHYIDYLRIIVDDLNWGSDEIFAFLQSHKKRIDDGLLAGKGSTKRKYTWLRDYHNKSLDYAMNSGGIDLREIEERKNWEQLRITL